MTRRSPSSLSHNRDGVGLLYRPGPGGPESRKRKREKERKRAVSLRISQVTWKTNEAHTQDLYRS